MRGRGHLAVSIGLAVLTGVSTQGVPSPEDTAADYSLANKALQTLVATPLGQTLPRLPWKVDLIESWQVNAYSNGHGQIAITRGLAFILGDHPGVWAAAIAHELGHAVMLYPACQPQFDAEFRKAYLASGGSLAGPEAESALRVSPAGGGLLNLKGQRRIEYTADRLGLLLMAEAGYHPEYAVALDRLMQSATGDQAKFSEFLLSHPLWSDREEQIVRDEGTALAIFNHGWPDATRSPGGAAPPIGGIESVKVSKDPHSQALLLRVGFEIRNARHRQVRVASVLLDQNRKVRTPLAFYQAPDGSLALNAMIPELDHGSSETTLRIPVEAVAGQPRKLKAELFLVADDWTLSVWFQPVEFPSQN
jgi:Peptidase family M48